LEVGNLRSAAAGARIEASIQSVRVRSAHANYYEVMKHKHLGIMEKKVTKPVSPLDRPLGRGRGEVSGSAFALLFAELLQYSQNRVAHVHELENKLSDAGYQVGIRLLEAIGLRERAGKRETRIVPLLSFIASSIWPIVFNRKADLERSIENEDECMSTSCEYFL